MKLVKWAGWLVAASFALVLWANASEMGRWVMAGVAFVAYIYHLTQQAAAQDRALIIQQLQVAAARLDELERRAGELERR